MTLAAVIAASGTAVAEDPVGEVTEVPVVETVPPLEPEETDLVEVPPSVDLEDEVSDLPSSKPSDFPDASACEPGYRYYPTTKDKDYHRGVGATNSNYNGTTRTARSTFTSEVTGEVGLAFRGELGVEGKIAVVKMEAKFGVELSLKLTAKLGNTITVETPPKTTTNARYGVYRLKSYGYSQYIYNNCNRGTKNNVTIYTPRRVGWYLWES
jgi:hypothetical protein